MLIMLFIEKIAMLHTNKHSYNSIILCTVPHRFTYIRHSNNKVQLI